MENILCEYGCGNKVKHKLKNGKLICSKYSTQCPINKVKNSKALSNAHKTNNMYVFTSEDRAKSIKSAIKNKKQNIPFEELGKILQRQIIMEEQEYKCNICNLSKWQGNDMVLELDHINGNRSDNSKSNLRFLCPNCHSQTSTWRGRNINTGICKVTDEILIDALLNTSNIRQALIKVGLAAKGGNYERAKKILSAFKET